jgi:hypothetical protein
MTTRRPSLFQRALFLYLIIIPCFALLVYRSFQTANIATFSSVDDGDILTHRPPPSSPSSSSSSSVPLTTATRTRNNNFTRQDSSNNSNNEKPYLIIHVGPPKTGTTTLQEQLFAVKDDWLQAADNVVYAGAFYDQHGQHVGRLPIMESLILNTSCHEELAQTRRRRRHSSTITSNGNRAQSLAEELRRVPCWNHVLQELYAYRQEKNTHAIIFSNEVLSTKWNIRLQDDDDDDDSSSTTGNNRFAHHSYRAPLDWITMQLTLAQDWNVIVVISYRRYMDWIVSSKRQQERYKSSKAHLRLWPALPPTQQQQQQQPGSNTGGDSTAGTTTTAMVGRASMPLLPKLALQIVPSYHYPIPVRLANNSTSSTSSSSTNTNNPGQPTRMMLAKTHPAVPFYFTDVVLQQYLPFFSSPQTTSSSSASFQIRIFNLHEAAARNVSLLTLFLCDTLPFGQALHSCRYSCQRDDDDAQQRQRQQQQVALQQKHKQSYTTAAAGNGHHHHHVMANQHDDAMLRMTYYDAIATAAVAAGLVNATRIQRRQVVLACKDFDESLHQQVINRHGDRKEQHQRQQASFLTSSSSSASSSLSSSLSSLHFPLICPTHAQYKAFLDLS